MFWLKIINSHAFTAFQQITMLDFNYLKIFIFGFNDALDKRKNLDCFYLKKSDFSCLYYVLKKIHFIIFYQQNVLNLTYSHPNFYFLFEKMNFMHFSSKIKIK